jgi:hypothetical protein
MCVDLQLRWGLKKSCSLCQALFNSIWQPTWTQGYQGDSWFLAVGSQIGNLTPDPSFGHNLCFKYPNGSCEPILDIYISRAFQWYKELLNPICFDPYNCPLQIWESIGTPIPKVGAHFGVWGFIPSHSLAFRGAWNVIPGLHSWPTPLQAFALVVSSRLGYDIEPIQKINKMAWWRAKWLIKWPKDPTLNNFSNTTIVRVLNLM